METGLKDLKIPNVLKVSLGQMNQDDDEVIVMETNIDDSNSEILGYTSQQLFENGALDVIKISWNCYKILFLNKHQRSEFVIAMKKERYYHAR